MIQYSPIDGLPIQGKIKSQPKHIFLISSLSKSTPEEVQSIRVIIDTISANNGFKIIDASDIITGRDFLLNIWKQIASVPICIAIYHHEVKDTTQYNIFYELGVAQALGKENVIIKTKNTKIPSDFVRSEYIEFNNDFEKNFNKFIQQLKEQGEFYEEMSHDTENNPVLAIDFLRRSYLLTGNKNLKIQAKTIISQFKDKRAKNSIETMLAQF